MSRRTPLSGDLSSRKRRTDRRSSSCSSLKAKFTLTCPPWALGRRRPFLVHRLGYMHYEDSQAEIHRVVVGPMDNNVYVLRCKETGEAVLLDAANEHEKLLELCRTLDVRRVLETHGHWDHIHAVPAVRGAGYELGVTSADASMLPSYDFVLEDDSVIQVGRLRLRTIATPGHTSGS